MRVPNSRKKHRTYSEQLLLKQGAHQLHLAIIFVLPHCIISLTRNNIQSFRLRTVSQDLLLEGIKSHYVELVQPRDKYEAFSRKWFLMLLEEAHRILQ